MITMLITQPVALALPSLLANYFPAESILQQARAMAVARAIDEALSEPSGKAQEILLAPRSSFELRPLPTPIH